MVSPAWLWAAAVCLSTFAAGELPPSTQVLLNGILEDATLDAACATDPNCGGTLQVNGQTVIVPKNLLVQFPSQQYTWQEVMTGKPDIASQVTGSGLAIKTGVFPPTTSYTVNVIGNQLPDTANADAYDIIAAMVAITQVDIYAGQGYISAIDYDTGIISVASTSTGTALSTAPNAVPPTTARIVINDATDTFGKPQLLLDKRFAADVDNPTIHASTGYPHCLPRTATGDVKCPSDNRPVDPVTKLPLFTFYVNEPKTCPGAATDPPACRICDNNDPPGTNPPNHPIAGCVGTSRPTGDSTKPIPLVVGDFISFIGVTHPPGTIPGLNPDFTLVAAFEVESNVAAYTLPGIDPAYVNFEGALVGVGGWEAAGIMEVASRSRFEGASTDWTRPVVVYARDFNPITGNAVKRMLGTVMPDSGLWIIPPDPNALLRAPVPAIVGAIQGRWRIRPPCNLLSPKRSGALNIPQLTPWLLNPDATLVPGSGSDYPGNKGCTQPPGGVYTPAMREVQVHVYSYTVNNNTGLYTLGPCTPAPHPSGNVDKSLGCTFINPTIEYLWGENTPGMPAIENNFLAFPALAYGGYGSSLGTTLGVLDPFPASKKPLECATFASPVKVQAKPDAITAAVPPPPAVEISGGVGFVSELRPFSGAPGDLYTLVLDPTTQSQFYVPNPLATKFDPLTGPPSIGAPFVHKWLEPGGAEAINCAHGCGTPAAVFTGVQPPAAAGDFYQHVVYDACGKEVGFISYPYTTQVSGPDQDFQNFILDYPDQTTTQNSVAAFVARVSVPVGIGHNPPVPFRQTGTAPGAFDWGVPTGITQTHTPAFSGADVMQVNELAVPASVPPGTYNIDAFILFTQIKKTFRLHVLPSPTFITSVVFRCDKHRLTVTLGAIGAVAVAADARGGGRAGGGFITPSGLVDANGVYTLEQYQDRSGNWFDPRSLGIVPKFVPNPVAAGGGFVMTLSPVPMPQYISVYMNGTLLDSSGITHVRGSCIL